MFHAFPCGTPALDFLGSRKARRNDEPTEMLDTPEHLDAWFTESGLLDEAPGADAHDLEHAVALREAIYLLVDARRTGAPLPEDAAAQVNLEAEGLPIDVRLDDSDARGIERTGSVSQALSTLAREAVEIVGGPDAVLLRECARPECTQVYVDRSRGARREWCSMKTCGNRVKASKFRERHRAAASAR